jgi:hypothetical protein
MVFINALGAPQKNLLSQIKGAVFIIVTQHFEVRGRTRDTVYANPFKYL